MGELAKSVPSVPFSAWRIVVQETRAERGARHRVLMPELPFIAP